MKYLFSERCMNGSLKTVDSSDRIRIRHAGQDVVLPGVRLPLTQTIEVVVIVRTDC